jgi:hypothetical protein
MSEASIVTDENHEGEIKPNRSKTNQHYIREKKKMDEVNAKLEEMDTEEARKTSLVDKFLEKNTTGFQILI